MPEALQPKTVPTFAVIPERDEDSLRRFFRPREMWAAGRFYQGIGLVAPLPLLLAVARFMKSILPALALLSSASVAFAGSEVAYQSSSDAVTSAANDSTWYVGASVGHLSNRDEALYTLHLGANILRSGPLTHSLFAEVGYSEKDDGYAEGQFIPVTLNYKVDYQTGGRFSLYAGVGAGAVWMDDPTYGFATNREDLVEFMAQAFAGIGYEVCPSFQLYAGNRYIWIDESDRYFKSDDTGDDVVMEIGARFRF
jgi:hypothetical protein